VGPRRANELRFFFLWRGPCRASSRAGRDGHQGATTHEKTLSSLRKGPAKQVAGVIERDAIGPRLKAGVTRLGGARCITGKPINETLRFEHQTVVNKIVDPTFLFQTVDHYGKD